MPPEMKTQNLDNILIQIDKKAIQQEKKKREINKAQLS